MVIPFVKSLQSMMSVLTSLMIVKLIFHTRNIVVVLLLSLKLLSKMLSGLSMGISLPMVLLLILMLLRQVLILFVEASKHLTVRVVSLLAIL